jgi:toxin ParE1/3/4
MGHYTVSDKAARDLAEIWDYLAEQSGSEQVADRFIDKLMANFDTLATMPDMGRTRSYLPPEVLAFPHDNYLIFYVQTATGISVVHVLYGGQDLLTFFGEK